eukprot:839289-Rhodomonas_salina.1
MCIRDSSTTGQRTACAIAGRLCSVRRLCCVQPHLVCPEPRLLLPQTQPSLSRKGAENFKEPASCPSSARGHAIAISTREQSHIATANALTPYSHHVTGSRQATHGTSAVQDTIMQQRAPWSRRARETAPPPQQACTLAAHLRPVFQSALLPRYRSEKAQGPSG